MRLFLKAVLAVGALQLCAAAPAQPVAPAEAPSDAQLTAALELVGLMSPFDLLLATNLQGWEIAVRQKLALDPGTKNLEAQYPGVVSAGIAGARQIARDYCERFVKESMEIKAGMIARQLTSVEIADAATFFASGPGRRYIRSLAGNVDVTKMASDVATHAAETGKIVVSAEATRQTEHAAVRKTSGEMSPDDQIALMRFSRKPAAAKLSAANQAADVEILKIVNNPDPDWMAKQSQAVTSAMLAFVDAHRAQ